MALEEEKNLPLISSEMTQHLEIYKSGREISHEIKKRNIAMLDSSAVFPVPLMKDEYKIWNIRMYVTNPFYYLISNILGRDFSIKEAVQIYNDRLQADGVYEIFDEINGGLEIN